MSHDIVTSKTVMKEPFKLSMFPASGNLVDTKDKALLAPLFTDRIFASDKSG